MFIPTLMSMGRGLLTSLDAGRLGLDSLPPEPSLKLPNIEWQAAYHAHHAADAALPFQDIDLPHVGETFKDGSPQECADTLRMLKGLGYHVPDGVIEELYSEELEE